MDVIVRIRVTDGEREMVDAIDELQSELGCLSWGELASVKFVAERQRVNRYGVDVEDLQVRLAAAGILTVGALADALARCPREMHVCVDDADGWYNNVAEVISPVDEPDFSAVTLRPGAPLDTRQF